MVRQSITDAVCAVCGQLRFPRLQRNWRPLCNWRPRKEKVVSSSSSREVRIRVLDSFSVVEFSRVPNPPNQRNGYWGTWVSSQWLKPSRTKSHEITGGQLGTFLAEVLSSNRSEACRQGWPRELRESNPWINSKTGSQIPFPQIGWLEVGGWCPIIHLPSRRTRGPYPQTTHPNHKLVI